MGDFAAGTGGLLGGLLTQAMDVIYTNADRNWMSGLDTTKYLKDYDKAINDYFLNKQMDYNSMMSNTAYQRAVADMKAAGLNPASMAGAQVSPSSSPSVNAAYHSGQQAVANHLGNSPFASSIMNSAVNAMIAKDNNAAKLMAAEIVDNAKHAHRMEELREKADLNHARERASKDLSAARYYDALSDKIENSNFLRRHGYK